MIYLYYQQNKIPETTIVAFGAVTDTQNFSIYIHIMDINASEYHP